MDNQNISLKSLRKKLSYGSCKYVLFCTYIVNALLRHYSLHSAVSCLYTYFGCLCDLSQGRFASID